jgi:hypothetical protein
MFMTQARLLLTGWFLYLLRNGDTDHPPPDLYRRVLNLDKPSEDEAQNDTAPWWQDESRLRVFGHLGLLNS